MPELVLGPLLRHVGEIELRENELLHEVHRHDDAGPMLRDFVRDADRQPGHSRWSYCRDFGHTRLVVIDSRGGRDVTPGHRRMIDEGEWEWVESKAAGGFEHLLLASSVPFLLSQARELPGALARAARVEPPIIDWQMVEDPTYNNQGGMLTLAPGQARVIVETTAGAEWRDPRLSPVFERRLVGAPRGTRAPEVQVRTG